jgi:hypothetical protein
MKPTYIYLAFIAILGWNAFLIQRDTKLFKAYDTKCAEISHAHSRCHLSK